jgi:hypothetical protein
MLLYTMAFITVRDESLALQATLRIKGFKYFRN